MIPVISFQDIQLGFKVTQIYQITDKVYSFFLEAFGDVNPLHVDDLFAQEKGFERKVMHGSILNGFVSHFIGMVFPGRDAILSSVDIRFHAPNYLNDELLFNGEVIQKVESQSVILFQIEILNKTRNQKTAVAKILVKIGRA